MLLKVSRCIRGFAKIPVIGMQWKSSAVKAKPSPFIRAEPFENLLSRMWNSAHEIRLTTPLHMPFAIKTKFLVNTVSLATLSKNRFFGSAESVLAWFRQHCY